MNLLLTLAFPEIAALALGVLWYVMGLCAGRKGQL